MSLRQGNNPLRIAVFFPEIEWLDQILAGEPTDAAVIQQKYITSGLAQKYDLTWIAPTEHYRLSYCTQASPRQIAPQTWSASFCFRWARKLAWRIQQLLHIPYLNYFSNYSRYDALLRILPGHHLVYERNSLYNMSAAMACKRLNLPYLMFLDADQILEQDFLGKPLTGWLRWRAENIFKFNLKIARAILCVSEQAKEHLVHHWLVPEEKIVVFPNAVDTTVFAPDEARRQAVRAELGYLDENIVFLFVGSFYKWHDVPTLLKAFSQVWRAYPFSRLVLVGRGEQLPAMQQLAGELEISSAVRFTGAIPHQEVPNLIRAADVAVAPVPAMERDLWLSPMKLFEYMAAGAAVIATGVGQIAQVIAHRRNGWLVPAGDSTALAEAMKALVASPELRAQLGRQARADAVEKYSWEVYLRRLDDLLTSILSGFPA